MGTEGQAQSGAWSQGSGELEQSAILNRRKLRQGNAGGAFVKVRPHFLATCPGRNGSQTSPARVGIRVPTQAGQASIRPVDHDGDVDGGREALVHGAGMRDPLQRGLRLRG